MTCVLQPLRWWYEIFRDRMTAERTMRRTTLLVTAATLILAGGVLLGNPGETLAPLTEPVVPAVPAASAKVSEPAAGEAAWRETSKPKAVRGKSGK